MDDREQKKVWGGLFCLSCAPLRESVNPHPVPSLAPQDGSALFVTIAKYTTPQFHEIDQVGINPDYSCSQPFAQTASATKPRIPNSSSLASILTETEDDACVKSARSFLSHLPRRDA